LEYTATGWLVFLNESVASQDLEENGIKWLVLVVKAAIFGGGHLDRLCPPVTGGDPGEWRVGRLPRSAVSWTLSPLSGDLERTDDPAGVE
jgi:hypothetical protein